MIGLVSRAPRSNKRVNFLMGFLILILLLGFLTRPWSGTGKVVRAAPGPGETRLTLYFTFHTPNAFYLFPVNTSIPDTKTPAAAAMELLIQGPPPGGPLWSGIPRDTRLLGVEIKDGTAYVNFSREITRANVGSSGEALLVQSIVATLGQFPTVKRVKILVEGQPVETLAGHVDLTGYLTPQFDKVYRGFPDTRGHWSEGEVLAFSLRGVLSGYPDGTFAPEEKTTRAEFIKMVLAGLDLLKPGSEGKPVGTPTFTDVGESSWFFPYIERAVSLGIVRPQDYGPAFAPEEKLTRREMAVLVVRAMGLEGEAARKRGADLPFADTVNLPDWAKGYLAAAAERKYLRGYEDGTFRPNGQATRAEATAVLGRLLNLGQGAMYLAQPQRDQRLTGQVLIMGAASVFEASVCFRLKSKTGRLLQEDCLMASEGAPGWGVFGGLFNLAPVEEKEGMVEAFYYSPKDGQERNVISIPVRFGQ
ncbi:MAG: S-layer homology domain-containing protein [Firmicutes bacterium]|nr:S-layer homology domain-containing protein [Bacillota bacterium]